MSTFLTWSLPLPIVASAGTGVGLSSILTSQFGSTNWSSYWVTYYPASQLAAWNFRYWNPSNPSVATWLVNGVDIGGGFDHQTYVPGGSINSATFRAGNDIGPLAYLAVPAGGAADPFSEYIQYSAITVDPHVLSPVAGHGEPTPADIVATAYRFANFYGNQIFADNDCHNIASAVAAATGATLPVNSGNGDDPTQNEDGGFWRVVYRGSDPNPVANWHTLVQPGDIVRMHWNANTSGTVHTTLILAVNPDGSMVVYDNAVTGYIAVRTVSYDQYTIPGSITIYRLASDGLYLEQGSAQSETLYGTLFNDHIVGGGGDDALSGGAGNDVLDGGSGFNSVSYSGPLSQYQVSQSGNVIQVTDLRSGSPEGADRLTNVQRLTFADRSESAPVASASDRAVTKNASLAASSLFSASDSDGDAMTAFRFWDSTADASSGHFAINGVAQGVNQNINVSAAQLAQTTFLTGTTADDLWVQVFDGILWSGWKEFHLTPPVNHAPVVAATDQAVAKNASLAASSLFSASDSDGDTMTAFRFWDSTADASSGHFAINGVVQGTNQNINVSAAQLAQTTFQTGTTADDLWVQVFDGTAWSAWKEFHLTPPVNHAPVATASDFTATHNQNIAASSLFSASDADGDTITQYQFWDSTSDPASGHFVVGGVVQGTNQNIDVSAAQLANTTFQSGSGSDDLWVRAFDGSTWSSWKEFHVNAPANHAPVVTGSDFTATANQTTAVSNLFSVTDVDGDAITNFQFWDSSTSGSSGHFAIGGAAQGTNQNIDVSASQLANTSFVGGTTPDDLWVRAYDGNQWSQWHEFHWLV